MILILLKFHCMYWAGVKYFYVFSHHIVESSEKNLVSSVRQYQATELAMNHF